MPWIDVVIVVLSLALILSASLAFVSWAFEPEQDYDDNDLVDALDRILEKEMRDRYGDDAVDEALARYRRD